MHLHRRHDLPAIAAAMAEARKFGAKHILVCDHSLGGAVARTFSLQLAATAAALANGDSGRGRGAPVTSPFATAVRKWLVAHSYTPAALNATRALASVHVRQAWLGKRETCWAGLSPSNTTARLTHRGCAAGNVTGGDLWKPSGAA